MLKLNKIFILLFLIITTILYLSVGCTSTTNFSNEIKDKETKYVPMGKTVYSPIEIKYTIENPIVTEELLLTQANNSYWSYFKIMGLKDKKVEEKVNGEIKALFDEMLPYAKGEIIVPYRGVKTLIPQEAKIDYSHLMVSPQFNSNNILSVTASASGSYINAADHNSYIHFSIMRTLNFDLNTGKTFKLQDVFTNDVNGLEIINDAIVNDIARRKITPMYDYSEYYKFELIAPFKGVSHQQKFFLSPYGINVIIDYENPEFDVGFNSTVVVIPYYSSQGQIAITEKFIYGEPIFESEPTSRRLLVDYHSNRVYDGDVYNENGTQWHLISGWPDDLPEKFIRIIDEYKIEQIEMVKLLSQESQIMFVEQNTFANRIGSFINISITTYISTQDYSQWNQNSWVYTNSGSLLELEDLFVENHDYQPLLKNSITKALGYYSKVNLEDFIDDIMFNLNDTSISFVVKPNKLNPNSMHPIHFTISFEEVGFNNLKIFN